MEQQTGSKSGKEYVKAVYCHPAYLTYMQSTSGYNAGLDEAQAGIKTAGRNNNNLRYTDDTKESVRATLKLNIQKTKIMASGLITSWQIDGKKVERAADFIFGGLEITADGDCSHEIKRGLLLLLLSHFSRVRLCVTP